MLGFFIWYIAMRYFRKLLQRLQRVFFGYTTPRCIGIDISTTAVKIVQLKADSLVIDKYKIFNLAKNQVSEGVINDIERIAEVIQNGWLEFKPDYEDVAIAIPQNAVIMRELKLPEISNSYKMDEFVREQLAKDLDNEDIDFDYVLKDATPDNQIASVVVAKKEKIEEYQAIIQMSGIKVAAIDVENYALQFLFEHLLSEKPGNQHIIILELGATRIKGLVFVGKSFILFNEITVNYTNLMEEIATDLGDPNYLRNYKSVYEYINELLISRNHIDRNLVTAIASDVAKMLQQLKSNALVEKKLNLSKDIECYLLGGNALIPGVLEEISQHFINRPMYATDFIYKNNDKFPKVDLMRLFTAISLASWGQKIDKN